MEPEMNERVCRHLRPAIESTLRESEQRGTGQSAPHGAGLATHLALKAKLGASVRVLAQEIREVRNVGRPVGDFVV